MFALYKENESDSYRMERERKRKREGQHIKVCRLSPYTHVSYVHYAFRQMFAQAKGVVEQSLSSLSRFVSFLFADIFFFASLFCSCIQLMSEDASFEYSTRRELEEEGERARKKREERARTPPPPLTSFCLYSSYSRQTIVVYNFFFLLHDQAGRRWTSITVSLGIHWSTSLICKTFSYITDTHTHVRLNQRQIWNASMIGSKNTKSFDSRSMTWIGKGNKKLTTVWFHLERCRPCTSVYLQYSNHSWY